MSQGSADTERGASFEFSHIIAFPGRSPSELQISPGLSLPEMVHCAWYRSAESVTANISVTFSYQNAWSRFILHFQKPLQKRNDSRLLLQSMKSSSTIHSAVACDTDKYVAGLRGYGDEHLLNLLT
ncbi:hypothetical protein CEXT_149701 [Caerostris extrusa]|uniref:Uncharacterized protein n=1 Tax=Caerostris extrusa TaxID=172846 RepID=A0AAV4XQ78_CAEEX|nr:hypothetical protein CEXT_149701 [Caerostris extrusa]